MNYIKKLQKDNEEKAECIKALSQELNFLEEYLLSSKFRCGDELDGYVSTQDVLNRIDNIRDHFVGVNF